METNQTKKKSFDNGRYKNNLQPYANTDLDTAAVVNFRMQTIK